VIEFDKPSCHQQGGSLSQADQVFRALLGYRVHPKPIWSRSAEHQFVVDQALHPPIEDPAPVFSRFVLHELPQLFVRDVPGSQDLL
jgi:hypothetical protein